jgi:aminoglycoside phosphotransferase (APT) family kinase protein
MALQSLLGKSLAMGSRSVIHEWGEGTVAKVPRLSTPDTWAKFEFDYTSAISACGVSVPAVVGMTVVDDRQVMLSQRVDGPTMWEALVANPSDAAAYGNQLAEIHLQLLRTRPPITIPSQRSRLSCKIREAARTKDPRVLRALDLLPANPSVMSLCHGDFHPKNIILSDDGPTIVDWFDVSRGNSYGDVMRTLLLLSDPAESADSKYHLPGASATVLRELRETYEHAMRGSLQLDAAKMQTWRIIEAAARLAEDVDDAPLLEALAEMPQT